MKRGIIIRGQVFKVAQIAPDCPDARLIQASAGVQHNLLPQVGDAFPLTPGDDQDGRWGDIFVPRGSGLGLHLGILNPTFFGITSI